MNFVEKLIERFIMANKRLKRWQRVVSVLSAIVVFITTYSLVLPAITIDKETASTQAGMEIAAASENEPDSDGTIFEAEPEDESEVEEQKEEETAEETQAEDTVLEASGSDSGSQEADISEDDSATAEDEAGTSDDGAAPANVDEQVESKEEENSDPSDTPESEDVVEEANESITNEISEVAGTSKTTETAEEIELITEWTQLTYEYIDESFENDPDDDVDDGYTVYAEFGADAKLPVGVELRVKEITKESDPEAYEAYYEKALSEMQDKYDENTELSFAKFYDISFVYNGVEVEPSGNVKVRIEYNKPVEVKTDENIDTVHFDKNNEEKPEVIQSEVDTKKQDDEDAMKAVEFESDQFSVYGVVASNTKEFHAEVISASGDTYEVIVSYGEDAKIPDGARLEVREVLMDEKKADESEYSEYLSKTAELFKHSEEDIAYARYFDITIIDEAGNEIEPKADVEVQIRLMDRNLTVSPKVLHFDSEPELMDTSDNGETIQFNASGFSVYGVVVVEEEEGTFVFRGEGYTVKVSYSKEAEIPFGTLLEVSEIEQGTEEYNKCLGQAWQEVNKEYFEVEKLRESYNDWMGELPDVSLVNLNMVHFFNIVLTYEEKEIQPKAPVKVEILYDKGLLAAGADVSGVVPLSTDTTVAANMENAETTVEGDAVNSFRYEQEKLSEVATYVGSKTHDGFTEPRLAPALSAEKTNPDVNIEPGQKDQGNKVLRALKGVLKANGNEIPSEEDETGLDVPTGSKTLVANTDTEDNEDGTYTLTLNVKGKSKTTYRTDVTKSNVLIIMDRSSSMITKTINNEELEWYYGTKNTSSFRPDIDESHGYTFYGIVDGERVPLNITSSWNDPTVTITYVVQTPFGPVSRNYPDDAPIYCRSKTTRMTGEQMVLSDLFNKLMDLNEASGNENDDIVEISVISFADERYDHKSYKNETEVGWTKGRDTSPLMNGVLSNRFTSGTNWEDAFQYAKDVMSAKKNSDGDGEDYYVVFLTDGEPTAFAGETGNAHHYNVEGGDDVGGGNIVAYNPSRDDAKYLVDSGYKFYNIFTYRTTEDEKYSIQLTNYAYTGIDDDDKTTQAVQEYFSDATTSQSLIDAFDNIFKIIATSQAHSSVSITDTLTTDAMTTTVVQGKTNGYIYKVTDPDGQELYTVTASGDLSNPTVKFHVPGSSTQDYTATSTTVDGKTVYSVTTAEGDVYKMALADINDETGNLVWDLSPVGTLMNDCTYSVSFIVWPDQEAYDYVAALNNGLEGYTWDTSAPTYEDLRDTKGYEKGGVERYPSIVKKTDGTFAVLTNTDQKVHYSVYETETINGEPVGEPVITGPFYFDLETPDPMPLKATKSQIEKIWHVDRDPGVLVQLLYELNGESKKYSIPFEILQGADQTHYTDVSLGWDSTLKPDGTETGYVWDPDSVIEDVVYGDRTYDVGTRWASDFSIATGLMLSQDQMDANQLDTTQYTSATYGGKTYYILEDGHDYTVGEPTITYQFDFTSPTYHPMLVDGVLMSVNMTKEGDTVTITKMEPISVDEDGVSSLVVENTLRGYLHVNKVVVDRNGNSVASDKTKFEYEITLENENPVFKGDHIPWYGINRLFYNDGNFHYYQAEPEGEGALTLTDEDGNTYAATCDGTFDPDIVGPTSVTYTDASGEQKTISLYGNQMTPSEGDEENGYKKVSADLGITQTETINIANIPSGTNYTITEKTAAGYSLVGITRKIGDAAAEEAGDIGSATISDEITVNAETSITYKNRRDAADLEIYKVTKDSLDNEEKTYIEGAEFTITMLDEEGSGNYKLDPESATQKPYYEKVITTDEDGHAKIDMLEVGYYEIKETKAPNGYIINTQPEYIKIEAGVMTRIRKVADDSSTSIDESLVVNWPENDDSEGLIRFEATTTGGAFTIGNEPGSELPYTGGPGTTLFTLLGTMLIAIAGFGMIRMKSSRR